MTKWWREREEKVSCEKNFTKILWIRFFFLQEETKEKKLVTKERDTYNMC